ncbi:hypothetical protein [Clostridium beijerinckii]|uniref:hypothetical protein n=1 Tax=Clostridium beijerinckii TaxID=1520 RepID=UPI00047D509F|nr:hypothetical protein [Clostridium beijerinckii]
MKKIILIIICISTMFTLTSCYKEHNTNFFEETSPYTKEAESNYSYEFNDNKLVISNKCSNLEITKSGTNEVKISMRKSVGGEDEEKLQEALDNIKCTFSDGTVNIEPEKDDGFLLNSRSIEATISIPKNIGMLDIESSVGNVELQGNFDNLKSDMKTGNLAYKGELKQGNFTASVGNVKLDLQSLDPAYKYDINDKVGDVEIKIPKESSINLTGPTNRGIEVGNDVKIDDNSATFNINSKVSNVKIDS